MDPADVDVEGAYTAADVEQLNRPGDGLPEDGITFEQGVANKVKKDRTAKKSAKSKITPAVVRTWLRIDPNGESSILQADKYKLTAKLGIQTRDLRLLDPHLATTYPSAILCRDKSIVVNLEHIKAIICTKFLMVVNPEEESSRNFIEHLKQRLNAPAAGFGNTSMGDLQKAAEKAAKEEKRKAGPAKQPAAAAMKGGQLNMNMELPFELRVLEICLDELATEFDHLTSELEASAYPALDSLATKVTSPRLERVRRIKNRLVRLTTRVETVREVLEKFLDDDEDMHDLNLTANEARDMQVAEPELARISRHSISTASTNSSIVESEVAEVEMLLEAYFMHFDNTYNRLQTLNEYIKDTEDLVNIKLDQHRNQLITTDLILTALTCALAIVTTVAGIFGMNLDSGVQDAPDVFNQVTISSCLGAIVLFTGFIVWAWRRGLLVFS